MFVSIPDLGGDGCSITITFGDVRGVARTWDPSENQSPCETATAPVALGARLPPFVLRARGNLVVARGVKVGVALGALAARHPGMDFRTASGVAFEIPTDWWERAGMLRFVRRSRHYAFTDMGRVSVVSIAEIAPMTRALNLPGYSRDGFDEGRMVSVLDAFCRATPLPPVEVNASASAGFRYALYDGMHRFYASIAAGYSHLPVVVVENIKAFLDAEEAEARAWKRAHGL